MGSHYKGSSQVSSHIKQKPDGKGIEIAPRALDIIWGNDSRYWRLPSDRSGEPVELLQVCWLEVTGSIGCGSGQLSKGDKYKVMFEVSTKPDAFGWSDSPVYLMVKVDGKYIWRKADLSKLESNKNKVIPDPDYSSPLILDVPSTAKGDDKFSFGLYEIWRGRWKGGLLIHRVIFEKI